MNQINPNFLNQYNNPHSQVRQNLIRDQELNQDQIPAQQIVAPPVVHPPVQYNIMMDIPLQENVVPLVPISRYKFPTEVWFLFGCLFEMIWLQCNFVHILWLSWYVTFGFWRHGMIKRKIRFWGELFNIFIWIVVNCYVFSGQNTAMFPFAIIMENLDYYFIGGQLVTIYTSYFSFATSQMYADFKLYIIRKKLQSRRNEILEKEMHKFIENEINHSKQMKEIQLGTYESVEENMMREEVSIHQREIVNVISCLLCFEKLWPGLNVLEKQTVRLGCSHRFHYLCLKKVIELGNGSCPICKKIFIQ